MKVKTLNIILAILLPFTGTGQSYFNVLLPDTHLFAFGNVQPVEDNFVVLGAGFNPIHRTFFVYTLDKNGEVVGYEPFGEPPQIFFGETIDIVSNGFVISGTILDSANDPLGDAIVARFGPEGQTQWFTRIELSEDETTRDHVITEHDDVVIAGITRSFGDTEGDFFLARLDSIGKVQWTKSFGENDVFEQCRSLVQTSDGGFALAGVKDMPNGEWNIWVVKTDEDGNIQWEENYGSEFSEFGGYIAESSDGHLIVAVNADTADDSKSTQFKLMKLKIQNGEMLFEKVYPQFQDAAFLTKPIINNDGSIVCAGIHMPEGDMRGIILKFTSTGELIWSRDYYNLLDRSNYIHDIKPTTDSGYVFCGQSSNQHGGLSKGWVVKLDCWGGDSITYDFSDSACVVYSNVTYYQSPVNDEIRLYPNPATDQVTVEFPEGLAVEAVELMNATGQVVFREVLPANGQQTTTHHKLQTSNFPSGLYWLKVQSTGGISYAKKLVLQ